jgi:hypothetical protein
MREKLTQGFRQSLNRHFNEKGGITPMSLSRNPDVDTYWKEYCASSTDVCCAIFMVP